MNISLKDKNNIYILSLLTVVCFFSFFGNLKKYSESKQMGFHQFIPAALKGWRLVRSDTPEEIDGLKFINEMFQGLYYHPVDGYLFLTIEYSSDSRRRYELHFPDICQEVRGDRVIKFPPFHVAVRTGESFPVALLAWESELKPQKALCAYWYVVGGKSSISTLRLKIKQIFAGLFNRPEDSVLVRIDAFYDKALNKTQKEKKVVILKTFIADLYSKLSSHSRRILYGE